MIGRFAVVCLLLAAPAAAQTRVYTNADLGKPLTWTHTPTPEEMASLIANQFVPMPHIPEAPAVRTINGDPSHGPFGPFELSAYTQPLDPNWYDIGLGYWGGYGGPGFITSYPPGRGKRGPGSGGGFGSWGRGFRRNTHPPGGSPRPGNGSTPPPAPAPLPAPGGSTRLAGNAAAVRRPARP
jgi:hypothetical protein